MAPREGRIQAWTRWSVYLVLVKLGPRVFGLGRFPLICVLFGVVVLSGFVVNQIKKIIELDMS